MAILTIRNFDDELRMRLRRRAAAHDRSMEEEVRQILAHALSEEPSDPTSFVDQLRARFRGLGDVRLSIPARERIPDTRQRPVAERRPAGPAAKRSTKSS